MIFCFKTPVQIAKRKAVLTLDTEELEMLWARRDYAIVFQRANCYVTVPLSNIRYWRVPYDDPKQTTDEAE